MVIFLKDFFLPAMEHDVIPDKAATPANAVVFMKFLLEAIIDSSYYTFFIDYTRNPSWGMMKRKSVNTKT